MYKLLSEIYSQIIYIEYMYVTVIYFEIWSIINKAFSFSELKKHDVCMY